MIFPEYRPRRMRQNETLRGLIRETRLAPDQMILPLFIMPGKGKREEISSMPGVFRLSVDQLGGEAKECRKKRTPWVQERMPRTGSCRGRYVN